MLEKDLNRDLVRLFKDHGWAYKIPDPPASIALTASPRPFDGLAAFKGFDFFFESKLIKNKISAFSIARIEDHQFENLLKLRDLEKETAIILGIWIARKSYQILIFDTHFLYTLGNKSILKKQLECYIAEGYAIDMRHTEKFEPEMLLKRRIDKLITGRGNG
jgi:penicillin-binding protein-related factor A (putative recombinase)